MDLLLSRRVIQHIVAFKGKDEEMLPSELTNLSAAA